MKARPRVLLAGSKSLLTPEFDLVNIVEDGRRSEAFLLGVHRLKGNPPDAHE
jgi:hypothetical protein